MQNFHRSGTLKLLVSYVDHIFMHQVSCIHIKFSDTYVRAIFPYQCNDSCIKKAFYFLQKENCQIHVNSINQEQTLTQSLLSPQSPLVSNLLSPYDNLRKHLVCVQSNQVSPSIEGLFLIVDLLQVKYYRSFLDTESLIGIMGNEHISFKSRTQCLDSQTSNVGTFDY